MKNEFITYRASSNDVNYLEKLSKIYGLNRSEVIRYLIKREVEDAQIINEIKSSDPVILASQLRIGGI